MEERTPRRQVHDIPSLDGIRAVSIIIVFLGHASIHTPLAGSSGVTIFFFLSGYLITTLLLREQERTGRISLVQFYLRRAFRILPALYTALALVLAFTNVIPDRIGGAATAATALHATNYWIIVEGRDDLVSSMYALWSLAVEEHFYLIFPLALLWSQRQRISRRVMAYLCASVCVLVLAWRCLLKFVGHAGFDRLYLSTDTRIDSILWGCVLALIAGSALNARTVGAWTLGMTGRRWWTGALLPLGVLTFWAAQAVPSTYAITVGYTVQALSLMLVFTAVIAFPDSLAGRLLNLRPVRLLGVLSYSFYLTHRMALLALDHLTSWGKYGVACGGFALSCVASWVVYSVIEQPAQRWGRAVLARRAATRIAAAA